MSVRAELIRLGLRTMKGRGTEADVPKGRRYMDAFRRITPNPPQHTVMTRCSAGSVPAVRVSTPRSREGHHVLYLHGGSYLYGSPDNYRDFLWRIANVTAAHVLCIDYRLAPEHPFPAALDDAVAAYRWLLASGADPQRTAIIGDSAGGGLTFGTLLRLRDEGTEMPAAAAGISPWTDLALTGATLITNASADPMLNAAQAPAYAKLYLGDADSKHPYASPLYGDARGLPPSLIQVGSDEILLSDAERLAANLRQAGVVTELEIWPRMPHVWHLFVRVMPEAGRAIARVGDFVRGRFAA